MAGILLNCPDKKKHSDWTLSGRNFAVYRSLRWNAYELVFSLFTKGMFERKLFCQ